MECVYIINEGEVYVTRDDKEIGTLKKGDFIGSLKRLYKNQKSEFTYSNFEPITLYALKKNDVVEFLDNNPGIQMKLFHEFE